MIAYPAMLDVPGELVTYLAGLLADERLARGTRAGTRALSCGKQALFALTWFRERRDIALIGRGLGISQATSYRYLDEAIDVLAAQAPDLHDTLARGRDEGWSHVVLDGKVVATDRLGIKTTSKKGATIDAWYSGKTRDFGGNIQALPRPDGLPVWISEVEPGSVHDLTAARTHVLGALYAAATDGLLTLADPGYHGAGIGVHTPVKQPTDGRDLDVDTRTHNKLLRSLRSLANADLPLCRRHKGKKSNGRKRHIATDTLGLLLTVVVTGAGLQDRDAALRLLTALRARLSTISLLWADGGYAGRLLPWAKRVLHLTVTIVKRSDQATGFTVLPRRWVVERTFAWISKFRRCTRDYETIPTHHEAIVYIASIMTMSRRLARTTQQ